MPELSAKKVALLFSALCAGALGMLIYFAQSAATQSSPAYSTWNTGPDGAKLLFEGLKEAGFGPVSRQYKPVTVQKPRQSTVFFLGVQAFSLNSEDAGYFDGMEEAAKRGNHLVIAVPEESTYTFRKDEKASLLETRWGIKFRSDHGIFSAVPVVDKNWQRIHDHVWQRPFGSGLITLVANGQRLNNKNVATVADNRALLYELVSSRPAVVFEEAHLGIQESGSIVGLARHYHLQGLMAGLVILAALFVWSRSVSFPPLPPVPDQPLNGLDTRSMLTELMSRYLKNDLLKTCVAEWNRTRGQAQALSVPAEISALAGYRQIQEDLMDKRKFRI